MKPGNSPIFTTLLFDSALKCWMKDPKRRIRYGDQSRKCLFLRNRLPRRNSRYTSNRRWTLPSSSGLRARLLRPTPYMWPPGALRSTPNTLFDLRWKPWSLHRRMRKHDSDTRRNNGRLARSYVYGIKKGLCAASSLRSHVCPGALSTASADT